MATYTEFTLSAYEKILMSSYGTRLGIGAVGSAITSYLARQVGGQVNFVNNTGSAISLPTWTGGPTMGLKPPIREIINYFYK